MIFLLSPKTIRYARRAATLLGTASLATFGTAAMAAEPANVAAEEVLITGSLIRGAPAVGVPVTQLGGEEFAEQAAVTVSDLFRKVPALSVIASTAHGAAGSNLTHAQRVNIHNQGASRTLMLIDGMRFPLTGVYADGYDPSIVPSIGLERIDVLAEGASGTYGSDAIAGVINLVMRRGFDGAVSQAMYQHVNDGAGKWQVGQLYGTVWDTGGVTLSLDHYSEEALHSNTRSFITWDFTPWGLDNRIPLRSSLPATLSFGTSFTAANAALPNVNTNPVGFSGSGCTNCLLVPAGQNGTGLTWASLLARPMIPQTPTAAGTNNLIDPHKYAEYTGAQQRTSVAMTFDQTVYEGVSVFFDGFFAHRNSPLHISPVVNPWPGGTFTNFVVPTINPYFPTGVPAGTTVKVNYSTVLELDAQMRGKETSSRWATGFNIDLPYEWRGRLFFANSVEKNRADVVNVANQNNIQAALGNVVFDPDGKQLPYTVGPTARTVTAADHVGQTARVVSLYPVGTTIRVINPTSVPFLNVFCDPTQFTCNDPRTLDFIRAHWIDINQYEIQQFGGNADGKIFTIPGGDVRAAVGFTWSSDRMITRAERDQGLFTAEDERPFDETLRREVWAVFGELNIPIVSEMNALPLVNDLDVQVSGRYDRYSDFGGTFNPKVGANWTLFEGITLRGTWGRSFAAPAFQYLSSTASKNTSPQNTAAGATTNSLTPVCGNGPYTAGLQPASGSAADVILDAIGAADCTDGAITSALAGLTAANPYFGYTLANIRNAGMLSSNGGAATAFGVVRPAGSLGPEKATNYSLGFDFAPTDFLAGLSLHATYFHVQIKDFLGGTPSGNNDLNDPDRRQFLTIKGGDSTNPAASYNEALASFLASPALAGGVTANTISVLRDQMTRNLYKQVLDGVDFGASYDREIADLGMFRIGLNGTYYLGDKVTTVKGGTTSNPYDELVNSWSVAGNTTSSRVRARAELGWEDPAMGLSVSFFTNYRSHYFSTDARPATAQLCNLLGIPISPITSCTSVLTGQALIDAQQTSAYFPEQFTFDLSIGYDLGDRPTNTYLQGLSFRLTINDLLDRNPPFQYRTANNGAGPVAFDPTQFSPLGRIIALQVTKNW